MAVDSTREGSRLMAARALYISRGRKRTVGFSRWRISRVSLTETPTDVSI